MGGGSAGMGGGGVKRGLYGKLPHVLQVYGKLPHRRSLTRERSESIVVGG